MFCIDRYFKLHKEKTKCHCIFSNRPFKCHCEFQVHWWLIYNFSSLYPTWAKALAFTAMAPLLRLQKNYCAVSYAAAQHTYLALGPLNQRDVSWGIISLSTHALSAIRAPRTLVLEQNWAREFFRKHLRKLLMVFPWYFYFL